LQTIGTLYTEFSYRYYQLLLQYTFNRCDSPWIEPDGTLREAHLETDVSHYRAQVKIRFPFWVGGYGAVRYEIMDPEPISSDVISYDWPPTSDKQRWEAVVGYKIDRNITAKVSYLHSRLFRPTGGADPLGIEDDVFAIQLSAGF
jgi:hypothetical protein